jgi:hypothetical protein
MKTNCRAQELEMRWVPVTDAQGRTHMEAVWVAPVVAGKPSKPSVAARHAA